jgi:hypothetical protein
MDGIEPTAGAENMFGTIDTPRARRPSGMLGTDTLFDRETLLDILVNAVPVGILLFFTLLFLSYGSYPDNTLVTVVQISLILIPVVVVAVITYYAAKAVSKAEQAGGDEIPPGYSRADAEMTPEADDD